MARIILTTIVLSALLVPSLASGVDFGAPFQLGPGQSAELSDGELLITFTGILVDTRCPEGAVCLWEGDAETALAASWSFLMTPAFPLAMSPGGTPNPHTCST